MASQWQKREGKGREKREDERDMKWKKKMMR